jgi:hypothetical protein
VYWSAHDSQNVSGYAQTFWDEIPGLKNAINIIGVVPYQVAPGQRYIFLFSRMPDKGKQKVIFTKYDLEKQAWDSEPSDLETPKDGKEAVTSFTAVLKQRNREDNPPHLAIRVPSGAIYERRLNHDGSDWADDDWKPIIGSARGSEFSEISAMVEIAPDEYYLFVRSYDGSFLGYRALGSRDDGYWHPLLFEGLVNGSIKGAFSWPGTNDIYLFFNTVLNKHYAIVKQYDTPLGRNFIYQVGQLNAWLRQVAGVSLDSLIIDDGTLYTGMTVLKAFVLPVPTVPSAWSGIGPAGSVGVPSTIPEALLRKYSDYIASQINSNEAWREWKLADEMVQRFTLNNIRLKDALNNVFPEGRATGTQFRLRSEPPQEVFSGVVSGLERIVPSSTGNVAYKRTDGQAGVYRSTFSRSGDSLSEIPSRTRVAPYVTGPFEFPERLSERDLQYRRCLFSRPMLRSVLAVRPVQSSNLNPSLIVTCQ